MRKTLITLTTAAMLCIGGAAMADSQSYCASEWPGDFRMQAYCLKRQHEGVDNSLDFVDRHNISGITEDTDISDNPYAQMWVKCTNEWSLPQHKTWNWRMVDYCLKRQMEGYKALRRQ